MQIDGNDISDAKEETLDEMKLLGLPFPVYEDEVETILNLFIEKLTKKGR